MKWKDIRNRISVHQYLVEIGRAEEREPFKKWVYGEIEAPEPKKEVFNDITARTLLKQYQIGKVTVANIELWLGHKLPHNHKRDTHPSIVLELEEFAETLRAYGYEVTEPK